MVHKNSRIANVIRPQKGLKFADQPYGGILCYAFPHVKEIMGGRLLLLVEKAYIAFGNYVCPIKLRQPGAHSWDQNGYIK